MEMTDYVSYDLALKLKACGFDEPCDHYWYKVYTDSDKMEMRQALAYDYNNDDWSVPHCSAPHIYYAQKWLREKKGIEVNAIWSFEESAWFAYSSPMSRPQIMYADVSNTSYPIYEQALSEGIKSALELIKKA